jgi:hypothetical protein
MNCYQARGMYVSKSSLSKIRKVYDVLGPEGRSIVIAGSSTTFGFTALYDSKLVSEKANHRKSKDVCAYMQAHPSKYSKEEVRLIWHNMLTMCFLTF